ncbi:MgtC/SapB family protein [Yinghuangia seranimata]|uniref:MgtC/SapB family protein n=1 Tax=Yinghuangia seranimata TaxID=408067 RepID=UPI00248C274F|nr:MgtC/SapB family protein [Yinghuangia seranimata]MDI2130116.1 MgtC/SapB family protein [Yinghuangia seranimata]
MGGTMTAVSGIPGPSLAAPLHHGAGWPQLWEILLAFVLSSAIGAEREIRNKSAGLRTHALVGVGTALFVEVSKYGFADVLPPGAQGYDPSRIAAQIVSGIGFLGGGLIFVRRDSVNGLTTAAVVWLTCAVGMACAAGLPLLALAVTALHFVVVFGYTPLIRRFSTVDRQVAELRLTYLPAHAVLPRTLVAAVAHGFRVTDVAVHHRDHDPAASGAPDPVDRIRGRVTHVVLHLEAPPARRTDRRTAPRAEPSAEPQALIAELAEIDGILTVAAGDRQPTGSGG